MMGNETKALLITAAKDALLEIVVLVADKISEAASGMRTKELNIKGDFDGDFPDLNKGRMDPNAR